MSRPDYSEADTNDRLAYIGSRSDVLSKSFVTDLWVKVINRAIDDIVIYRVSKDNNKPIKEEELETVNDAYGFLFHDEYKVPFDDYLVKVECLECTLVNTIKMSLFASDSEKCLCGKIYNINLCTYTIIKDQRIKEVNLRQILEFWSIKNMSGFRNGVRERIEELIERKKEAAVRRVTFKQQRQLKKELEVEKKKGKLKKVSLKEEEWREYDFEDRIYRINEPKELYLYQGCTTHRIVDSKGLVHCLPAPGHRKCVLRWKPKNSKKPVQF
jgi:hypothetical protein